MVQAWIDGELGDSERVILDQHFGECPTCAAMLRKHQQSAALLFETFAEHRLKRSLRQRVMESLPEMDPLRIDVEGVNWRDRTHASKRTWLTRLVPIAAVLVLFCLAGLLYTAWPKEQGDLDTAVGVVTVVLGDTHYHPSKGLFRHAIALKDYVTCGNFYETGARGRLMLALRGPTQLRVDEKTKFQVCDDRELRVDIGRLVLEVGKGDRQFRVVTPSGTIVVYGTTFEVSVDNIRTTVTLKSGSLQIERGGIRSELKPGEQTCFARGQSAITIRTVDAAHVLEWANAIVPDTDAYDLFARQVQLRTPPEIEADQVFAVITTKNGKPRAVTSFHLTWTPNAGAAERCGYNVHVYNDAMRELFSEHIDGSVLANPNRKSYEIDVPGEPIANAGVLHIKIVPDVESGGKQTPLKVLAVGI
ncbi:MAG: FecR domain-containing protein [Candidatus Hydrogenedentes bacterium]|nr:FecR domain-containing protein [Candidatus Hydrogenedentota bacterium]